MNRWLTLALALTALGALLLRWPLPEQRPMHNDEAVNGLKFGRLWERGAYRYDPNEHHGPTLYYFTAAAAKLTGAPSNLPAITEQQLRWVTVAFGIGLICLLPFLQDGLGRGGVLWAAIFTALSPAFVFYSQYYIHEMLLVFFAAGVLGCAWRYWRSRRMVWAILCGVSLGLMAATKETFVISLAAAAAGLLLNQVWNRVIDATGAPVRAPRLKVWHLAFGFAAAVFTAILLFTSFLTNPAGPMDALRTYEPWLARAGGDSPHLHPWHFYAHRLVFFNPPKGPLWTEALLLVLAGVGAFAGFSRKGLGDARTSLIRFLAFYSVGLAVLYGAIWYKTPWCLLNFWHGFILLAGVGAAWLLRNTPKGWRQRIVALLLVTGAAHLGVEAHRAVTSLSADRRNPYVYAQTLPNLIKLTDRVAELSKHAMGADTLIKVVASESDYWPLPWYFRAYRNVGWWDALPSDPYAPIMVVSAKLNAALDEKGTHLMVGYYELRPSVFLELYVELEVWKRYLEARPPAEHEGHSSPASERACLRHHHAQQVGRGTM